MDLRRNNVFVYMWAFLWDGMQCWRWILLSPQVDVKEARKVEETHPQWDISDDEEKDEEGDSDISDYTTDDERQWWGIDTRFHVVYGGGWSIVLENPCITERGDEE